MVNAMNSAGACRAVLIVAGFLLGAHGTLPARADELSIERVLAPDRVIDISIDLPAADWNELCQQTRDPGKAFSGVVESPFTWFKGDITVDGVTIRSVGLRKKGFLGSLDNRWPSLKVKFDEFVEQSPIPGLEGLTLNNNKQDSSLASQFLAYELFNAAGVHAPRCSFVRMTVNGQYLGVYSNVESIGKPFLERRFGNNSGNLYEGTLADFYPKAVDRLDAKTNKKKHDRSKALRLATLLASDDPLALGEVEQLVDVDSFLRFWAMESLIGFWDGYSANQNNFWVYENRADGKFYFMPWGADGAFMPPPFAGFSSGGPVSVYAEGMLANRLYHDAPSAERYRETMRWLLTNVWKEDDLLKSINHVETLVTPHLHRRQANAPRAMESVRNFIRARRAKIEKELDAWPVRVAERPRKPIYIAAVGSARGTFETRWRENPPTKISETGASQVALDLGGDTVALKRSGASVHRPAKSLFGLGSRSPKDEHTTEIVIAGIRDSDSTVLTLTLPVDTKELSAAIGKPLAVRGSFADVGDSRRGPFGGKAITGTLTLTKATLQPDGVVEGQFDLTITETRGGFMDRRPGQGPPGRDGPPPRQNDGEKGTGEKGPPPPKE